jgi:hypothetical protein
MILQPAQTAGRPPQQHRKKREMPNQRRDALQRLDLALFKLEAQLEAVDSPPDLVRWLDAFEALVRQRRSLNASRPLLRLVRSSRPNRDVEPPTPRW